MLPLVVGTSDIGDTSVGGKDNNGSCLTFESSVQEREAFHIEHMDLINEEHSRHDFGLALLTPL
jgi:hypothetical protein